MNHIIIRMYKVKEDFHHMQVHILSMQAVLTINDQDQDQDQDSASGLNVSRLVGVGILPQPSSYKRLTRLYLERRAIQLGCNAGMAIRLPLPLGGKVLARCPGTRLYTSLKTNFVNEV